MNRKLQSILLQYVEKVKEIYAEQLVCVILYGSYARGDYNAESDIDVMILINADAETVKAKKEELIFMTYDFNTEFGLDIQPFARSKEFFDYWVDAHPFYKNVNKEGVTLYEAA